MRSKTLLRWLVFPLFFCVQLALAAPPKLIISKDSPLTKETASQAEQSSPEESHPTTPSDEIDEIMDFDAMFEESLDSNTPENSHQPSLEIYGSLGQRFSYRFSRRETTDVESVPAYEQLSKWESFVIPMVTLPINEFWKLHLELHLAYDHSYDIRGKEHFSQEHLDDEQITTDLREAFAHGSFPGGLSLKIGRQILVWGQAESSVLDVITPKDLREPGAYSENLFLPIVMSRLDYFHHIFHFQAFVLMERRFDKLPVNGSEFSLIDFPEKDSQSMDQNTVERGVSVGLSTQGFDLRGYHARILENRPSLQQNTGKDAGELFLTHHLVDLFGMSSTLFLDVILLKFEVAHFEGSEFFEAPGLKGRHIDTLWGIEYSSASNLSVSLERSHQRFETGSEDFEIASRSQTLLRYSQSWFDSRLSMTAIVALLDKLNEGALIGNLSASYRLSENLETIAGIALYQAQNHPLLEKLSSNDLFFLTFRYFFSHNSAPQPSVRNLVTPIVF